MKKLVSAQLILKTGESFMGYIPSSQTTEVSGEVIFNTGMVGYVESLTDPSYAGQILCFTYPLIGNYGVSAPNTWESNKIQVKGVIISELATFYSNHTAQRSLLKWLESENIPFITGLDTRALTHCLRVNGVIPGIITRLSKPRNNFIEFEAIDWVKQVTITEPIHYGEGRKK